MLSSNFQIKTFHLNDFVSLGRLVPFVRADWPDRIVRKWNGHAALTNGKHA